MVLGLTDGQSLTAFIADPMICSHVIPSVVCVPSREDDDQDQLSFTAIAEFKSLTQWRIRLGRTPRGSYANALPVASEALSFFK